MTREFTIELPKAVFEKLDYYGFNYEKNFTQQCKDVFLEILQCEMELKDE